MKAAGWRQLVTDAVRRADAGDTESLDMLAQMLENLDELTQYIRDSGYGVTGQLLKDMIDQILAERGAS